MKRRLLPFLISFILFACSKSDLPAVFEQASDFREIAHLNIGKSGAAEITAFDPETKRLFVVTNTGVTQIDVVDLSNPSLPKAIGSIDIAPFGGGVNSVSVHDGKLAAAVENKVKTQPGKVVVFATETYAVLKQVSVGALPDMITWSPDGNYLLTANEGEPGDDYTSDPEGTVSLISVRNDYSVTELTFRTFAQNAGTLFANGLRVFGPGASFSQDMEPEYITVSPDSRTAWVTLQENNAIAKIDLPAKMVTALFPLGFKDYAQASNAVDLGDRDGAVLLRKWNVKGMYQPDAIAVLEERGLPYLFTANEGDVREWTAFAEHKRVKDLSLDPSLGNPAELKSDVQLGRLHVTRTLGDTDKDGDYDALYSFGARSFSVWNGNTGAQIFDSGNELEQKAVYLGLYDDARSDDKGVEPEGLTLGTVGRQAVAFVGLERADALGIYDVSNPAQPRFIKMLPTGDAPEGITFIPAKQSPTGKSLVVVSSENDGSIRIYTTQ